MPFQIEHLQDSDSRLQIVQIFNDTSFAKIVLNQGASLQELTLNSIPVIQNLDPLQYQDTFASAILFPFASRIEQGKYSFSNVDYQLEVNEIERNNSLHGFVHNKEFQIINQHLDAKSASITLEFIELSLTKGFPFTYTIQLQYILTDYTLELKVRIINTSKSEFPFTIGWHPYFFSTDINQSFLKFDSKKQVVLDDHLIAVGTQEITNSTCFTLKNKSLDDCFYLNSNLIEYRTPMYTLALTTSEKENFLQVYTPSKKNTIAIEPTTGISNSFNNNVGLKSLLPQKSYQISWKLEVNSV